jgi:zinc transport system ATP-binding protein
MTILSTHGLTIQYEGNLALSDVDFELSRGEIVTIVGPNGSGKSTFLRAIIGAIAPAKGMVQKEAGLKIGYVPQKLSIDPTLPLTVERFMSLPVRWNKSVINAALSKAGVEALGKRQLSALSGGQFQRVLLARALLNEPDVLILDEATQGLDQQGAASFYRQIEQVRQTLGCAVLMVSHELHVVMSASDRVVCLNGHVCCHGTPELVASAPEYRALFGAGTGGALALYRHRHNHNHDDGCDHDHKEQDHA